MTIEFPSAGDISARRARVLASVSGASSVAFGLITVASATRAASRIDRALAPRLAARPHSKFRKRAAAIAPAGKWYVFLSVGFGLAGYAYLTSERRSRASAAAAIAASGAIAAVLEQAFDEVLPQPPMPPGRTKRQGVFPSGHAFVATAVALTGAYVLSREELVDSRVAFAVASAIPAINSGAKLATRKHWPSDVLAGLLAGVTVASACASAYEFKRSGSFISEY